MTLLEREDLPKWQRIKYDIELKIIMGVYGDGDTVPSVRTLAREYNVGTSTSQIVLDKLSQEGTVIMEQGIGTKVNGKAVKRLKKEHEKRLYAILEQACDYAEKLGQDPVKLVEEIRMRTEK